MPTSRVTVHFPCPVERVWQVVTDLTNTAWCSDLARVEVLDETHFVEYTKSGYATNFTVTAYESHRRWAFTMENGNMSGSWEGIFETAEGWRTVTCPAPGRASLRQRRTVPGSTALRSSTPGTGGCAPLSPAI